MTKLPTDGPDWARCPKCHGDGTIADRSVYGFKACEGPCGGTGKVPAPRAIPSEPGGS